MRHYDTGLGGNAPERALLAAVVLQAVADLDDPDENARYEAHQFFMARHGGWADMRRFYFDALGLDEGRVLASLGPRLSPPERPEVRLTFDVLYRGLPRVPFSISDLIRKHRRGYSQLRGLIQTCEDKGIVVPTRRGVFCRVDCLPPPDKPKEKPLKKPASVKAVVYSLLTEPRTFKDLIIATGGDVSDSTIRTVLREGRDSFELSRDDDGRYLIASNST